MGHASISYWPLGLGGAADTMVWGGVPTKWREQKSTSTYILKLRRNAAGVPYFATEASSHCHCHCRCRYLPLAITTTTVTPWLHRRHRRCHRHPWGLGWRRRWQWRDGTMPQQKRPRAIVSKIRRFALDRMTALWVGIVQSLLWCQIGSVVAIMGILGKDILFDAPRGCFEKPTAL